MCVQGRWESFAFEWISGQPCALQQCTECQEHRALVVEGFEVVQFEQQSDETDESVW